MQIQTINSTNSIGYNATLIAHIISVIFKTVTQKAFQYDSIFCCQMHWMWKNQFGSVNFFNVIQIILYPRIELKDNRLSDSGQRKIIFNTLVSKQE